MKPLPQGKSIGWMQAPASWITTHTLRFIGVVRVVIKGGEGFILIKKGKPLYYYFKKGTIELKGTPALDYFNSHPLIDFNLCKYNRDEFAWALNLCNIEDHEPGVTSVSVPVSRHPAVPFRPADPSIARPEDDKRIPEPDPVYPKEQGIENRTAVSVMVSRQPTLSSRPADPPVAKPDDDDRIPEPDLVYPKEQRIENRTTVSVPVSRQPTLSSRPADPPVAKPVDDNRTPEPDLVYPKVQKIERMTVSKPVSRQPTLSSRPADPPVAKPAGDKKIPAPVAVSPKIQTPYKRAVEPQCAAEDESDITILSQIRQIDGIVAVSVFNDNRFVITVGDTDSESLLQIARAMLATAKKITPRPTWGPFVHMTIELPAGNMIITPYRDNYLCLLTTKTINIGHIRRIIRDLQRRSVAHA
jgi:predicted regulator of Ras-like GTPase activity (Roadblock/LC7/MglB family)